MHDETCVIDKMINLGGNPFHTAIANNSGTHFKYCQVKAYIQTACESHDSIMDFSSYNNDFKQAMCKGIN